MDIDVFSAPELPVVFRLLRTALRCQGELEPRERLFLDTYARICGHALPPEDPQPVDTVDLQDVYFATGRQRKRLVQLAGMAVLLGHPVRTASFDFLRALARQLRTHDGVIDVIDALVRGRALRVRLMALRRGLAEILKEGYRAEGPRGVIRFLAAALLRRRVNADQIWNYKRLGLLPEGTLGREYWKHMTATGFAFPGEPQGIAHSVAYHDVAHVLAEHDVTPLGEIQQGSFQGGNRRDDGFFFIQFVILQFHHGIRVTPTAPPATGNFDPEKVLWAIHRGAQCKVDMTHQWDYWPLMRLPLHEARAQCGLLPKLQA